eukprot:g1402.t1
MMRRILRQGRVGMGGYLLLLLLLPFVFSLAAKEENACEGCNEMEFWPRNRCCMTNPMGCKVNDDGICERRAKGVEGTRVNDSLLKHMLTYTVAFPNDVVLTLAEKPVSWGASFEISSAHGSADNVQFVNVVVDDIDGDTYVRVQSNDSIKSSYCIVGLGEDLFTSDPNVYILDQKIWGGSSQFQCYIRKSNRSDVMFEVKTSSTVGVLKSGDDADGHGCKASAGEQWCATLHTCVHPWELKLHSGDDFSAFCEPSEEKTFLCNCPPSNKEWACGDEEYHALRNGSICPFYKALLGAGNDVDEHGCKPSTGMEWCDRLGKCIARWEHHLHSDADPSTGMEWCDRLGKCIARWEHHLHSDADVRSFCAKEEDAVQNDGLLGAGGDSDAHGCKPSTGMEWCDRLGKCIARWEHHLHSDADVRSFCAKEEEAVQNDGLLGAGGDSDAHGCKPSTGMEWCDRLGKCIARWEYHVHTQHDFDATCASCQSCLARQAVGENIACPGCMSVLRGGKPVPSVLGYWTYADESGCLQTSVNYGALWITMKGTGIDTGRPSSKIVHSDKTCRDLGYSTRAHNFDDLPGVVRFVYSGVTEWVK